MRKAYIILAHKNEAQVRRLIKSLDDGLSDFYIHIDLKSAIYDKVDQIKSDREHIHLVSSLKTEWGSFGLVEATLNAMYAIEKNHIDFERIILLSGQDYPIKDNSFINEYLKNSPHSIFLEYFPLPNYEKWQDGGGLYRVNKYFLGLSVFQKTAAKTINFLAGFIKPLQRKMVNMQHYSGSQWMIIDAYTLNYILSFVKKNRRYSLFHKYTFAPDELFFQTIILNSHDEKILSKLCNDNKMHMIWEEDGSAHPEVILINNFNTLCQSDALYARKFDMNVDSDILDLIDKKRETDQKIKFSNKTV